MIRVARNRGDVDMASLLAFCTRLAAVQRYVRHDPDCLQRAPDGAGPMPCTCGLAEAWAGWEDPSESDES